jgi:hypothetical protein
MALALIFKMFIKSSLSANAKITFAVLGRYRIERGLRVDEK